MRPHLLATSVAVLLALTLAGCSDDPQPIIEPAPSTTAAPSPEPTPSSTPTPEPETESAKEFIQRWQETNLSMQSNGDSEDFRALGLNCRSCEQIADRVDEIYGDGGGINPSGAELSHIEQVGSRGQTLVFEFQTDSGRIVVTDSDDNEVQILRGGIERFQMNVREVGSEWRVLRLTRIES